MGSRAPYLTDLDQWKAVLFSHEAKLELHHEKESFTTIKI